LAAVAVRRKKIVCLAVLAFPMPLTVTAVYLRIHVSILWL